MEKGLWRLIFDAEHRNARQMVGRMIGLTRCQWRKRDAVPCRIEIRPKGIMVAKQLREMSRLRLSRHTVDATVGNETRGTMKHKSCPSYAPTARPEGPGPTASVRPLSPKSLPEIWDCWAKAKVTSGPPTSSCHSAGVQWTHSQLLN